MLNRGSILNDARSLHFDSGCSEFARINDVQNKWTQESERVSASQDPLAMASVGAFVFQVQNAAAHR